MRQSHPSVLGMLSVEHVIGNHLDYLNKARAIRRDVSTRYQLGPGSQILLWLDLNSTIINETNNAAPWSHTPDHGTNLGQSYSNERNTCVSGAAETWQRR
jgi:hypothetical protein